MIEFGSPAWKSTCLSTICNSYIVLQSKYSVSVYTLSLPCKNKCMSIAKNYYDGMKLELYFLLTYVTYTTILKLEKQTFCFTKIKITSVFQTLDLLEIWEWLVKSLNRATDFASDLLINNLLNLWPVFIEACIFGIAHGPLEFLKVCRVSQIFQMKVSNSQYLSEDSHWKFKV